MQMWIGSHEESKSKKAAASLPKLKMLLEDDGEWTVKRIDIGSPSKEKLCQLYMRKKFIKTTIEEMVLVKDGDKIRKQRDDD